MSSSSASAALFSWLEQYLYLTCRPMMTHAIARLVEAIVATGTVKWFNPTKGYGFIAPDSGGQDIFLHISAVERAGLTTVNENAKIEYEVVSNKGKQSAENIKVK